MKALGQGAAIVAFVTATLGCNGDDRPSPALAERYDIVIAWCTDRLDSPTDFCERLTSSDGDRIVVNVIFGAAGGTSTAIEVRATEGGDAVQAPPPQRVPNDRSFLQGLDIERDALCSSTPCRLELTVVVDDQVAATDEFRFT